MDTIQWYPGHMVKAKRIIREHLKLVDLVVELTDARIPDASRNPDLIEIIGSKESVMVMNKADLADATISEQWLKHYKHLGMPGIVTNASHKSGVKVLIKWLIEQLAVVREKHLIKGRISYVPKIMVVGIPNVGKSSMINALSGGAARAKAENKPGITKGQQWIKCDHFHLLDVPGVLWPKFNDKIVGYKLAATGAIGDHVFQVEEVAQWLLSYLNVNYSQKLVERFKLSPMEHDLPNLSGEELLALVGKKRGCLVAGGEVNRLRSAELVLREYREGKIGTICLEFPNR